MKHVHTLVRAALAGLALLSAAGTVQAQAWPVKPVRVIVAWESSRAEPKSVSQGWPFSPRRMFAGLMSR